MKSYTKSKGYDFEEVSARTAEKVESAIKNFGKKIAEKKFKKISQPPLGGNPSSGSTTASNDSARNAGVHLQNPGPGGSAAGKKKEGGCC